jgi:hypothetical protein
VCVGAAVTLGAGGGGVGVRVGVGCAWMWPRTLSLNTPACVRACVRACACVSHCNTGLRLLAHYCMTDS